MSGFVIPPMTVTFDDGTEVLVVPKSRDMAGAEAAGFDFTAGGPIRGMYAVAFATLNRMSRQGSLPDGVKVPESLEALLDAADVDSVDDAEGKE